MRRAAWTPVALVCVLLTGCTSGRDIPPGPTPEEVQLIIDEQNASWWSQMFPEEPQPVVEPLEYIEPESSYFQSQKCIIEANIQGVRQTAEGGLSFASDDKTVQDAFNRAMYVCTLSYPIDVSQPELLGYLSAEQLDYLDDYYRERLAPCLRLLGYTVPDPSPRDDIQSSISYMPYWTMTPQPTTEAEWSMIDLWCQPAPFGPTWARGF